MWVMLMMMKPKIGGMVILCLDSSYKIRKLHKLGRCLGLFWQISFVIMEAMWMILVRAIFYLLAEKS